MRTAPPADQEIMADSSFQEMLARGLTEALRTGVGGWVEESMLSVEGWEELNIADVQTSVTWWHGDDDRNAPLSAVHRLLDQPPHARLVVWPQPATSCHIARKERSWTSCSHGLSDSRLFARCRAPFRVRDSTATRGQDRRSRMTRGQPRGVVRRH